MLSTEPSSKAMRARAFAWVFSISFQFTTDFGEAVIFCEPRAMLTAGITREISPARCAPPWGSAHTLAGSARQHETSAARPETYGDFVFIEDSPGIRAICP